MVHHWSTFSNYINKIYDMYNNYIKMLLFTNIIQFFLLSFFSYMCLCMEKTSNWDLVLFKQTLANKFSLEMLQKIYKYFVLFISFSRELWVVYSALPLRFPFFMRKKKAAERNCIFFLRFFEHDGTKEFEINRNHLLVPSKINAFHSTNIYIFFSPFLVYLHVFRYLLPKNAYNNII